jgi:hypothetical protein
MPPGRRSTYSWATCYLTLIANTDRHALNWGVLQAPSGALCLAPSFDHGSALGSGATDDYRTRTLAAGVEHWCRHPPRSRQLRFEAPAGATLVDIASRALTLASPGAQQHWMIESQASTCTYATM